MSYVLLNFARIAIWQFEIIALHSLSTFKILISQHVYSTFKIASYCMSGLILCIKSHLLHWSFPETSYKTSRHRNSLDISWHVGNYVIQIQKQHEMLQVFKKTGIATGWVGFQKSSLNNSIFETKWKINNICYLFITQEK